MKKMLCFLMALSGLQAALSAEQVRWLIEPEYAGLAEFSDSVMGSIFSGDFAGAIDMVRGATSISESDLLTLHASFEKQAPVIASAYGSPLDIHLIRENTVGDLLVELEYIERFERHFLHFNFKFYRGGEGWVVAALEFDDNLDTVF